MKSIKQDLPIGGESRNVEDVRDMSVQVGDDGGAASGTADLEGTIDGDNWMVLMSVPAPSLQDVPINNVSAVRVTTGTLASAKVTLRGFNVRGDS